VVSLEINARLNSFGVAGTAQGLSMGCWLSALVCNYLLSASAHRAKCCRGVAAARCLLLRLCYGRVVSVGLTGILEVYPLSYSLFLCIFYCVTKHA